MIITQARGAALTPIGILGFFLAARLREGRGFGWRPQWLGDSGWYGSAVPSGALATLEAMARCRAQILRRESYSCS